MDGDQRAAQYLSATFEQHIGKKIKFAALGQGDTTPAEGQIVRHGKHPFRESQGVNANRFATGRRPSGQRRPGLQLADRVG